MEGTLKPPKTLIELTFLWSKIYHVSGPSWILKVCVFVEKWFLAAVASGARLQLIKSLITVFMPNQLIAILVICATGRLQGHRPIYISSSKQCNDVICCTALFSYRWNFVIHGCIDGYSRLITYLKCSDNNWADTVFQCFIDATRQYGLPRRVHSDREGENVQVVEYMLLHPECGV